MCVVNWIEDGNGFQPEKRHIGEVYCGHSAETPIIFSKQLSPRPADSVSIISGGVAEESASSTSTR